MPPTQRKASTDLPDDPAAAASPSDDDFASALVGLTEPLRRRAYRLTRDASEADDLLQETMTKAWAARLSFQPGTNLRAWTYTILRNLFITQRRRFREVVDLDEQMVERLVATDADQHQVAELGEVLEAIGNLPSDQRSALHAVALEGLDYETAADRLSLTQGALKSRVHRARAALVQLVEEGFATPPQKELPCGPTPIIAGPSRFRGVWGRAKASNQPLWIG